MIKFLVHFHRTHTKCVFLLYDKTKHTQTFLVAARHLLVLFRKKYLLGPF